jgi:hypothetical protein
MWAAALADSPIELPASATTTPALIAAAAGIAGLVLTTIVAPIVNDWIQRRRGPEQAVTPVAVPDPEVLERVAGLESWRTEVDRWRSDIDNYLRRQQP